MSERTVTHATFAVERSYAVPPARVFEAWADPVAKARWFGGDDWDHELDFSVGGREVSTGTMEGTSLHLRRPLSGHRPGRADRLLVRSAHGRGPDLGLAGDGRAHAGGEGTKLVFTEQGAFLDGLDDPSQRENGTGSLLDALGKELER